MKSRILTLMTLFGEIVLGLGLWIFKLHHYRKAFDT